MISVPAMRLHQFGVFLYQAILGARDVDRLVRFEVLAYDGAHDGTTGKKRKPQATRVNWELLERRIAASAEAYQRRGLTFKQGFGMTEVGVNCFAMTDEASVSKRGSIGTPVMHTEVRLVDGEGRDVAPGEVGEMWFRGPHVSLGYWNRPDATAESRAGSGEAGGWFRSGDLARRDEDGYYYVAGRAKEMFISGGVNVYPAEIEAALLQHPGVRDAAVVGMAAPKTTVPEALPTE